MYAIPDDSYPGGWFYRFQYYHPEGGEILRYDNAHDDRERGQHHRHARFGDDSELPFRGIIPHVSRFLQETAELSEKMTHD